MTIKCENSSTNMYQIISPQCWGKNATHIITVLYSKFSKESDTHKLCKTCMQNLKKDAEKHGYVVTIKQL